MKDVKLNINQINLHQEQNSNSNMKKINWEEIKTAHGNASQVIDSIQKLNSPDEIIRRDAYWQLDNHVIIQSDLYEASYYVIEPIVEVLEKDYTVDRKYPLRILAEISLGGNGNRLMQLQDTDDNVEKSIFKACHDKLKQLKNRIEAIVVHTEEESNEKMDILNNI